MDERWGVVACSACKPGSVEAGPLYPTRSKVIRSSDGHSSRSAVARALKQPTRGFDASPTAECPVCEVGHLSPPIWPCSDRGLPSHACCQARGGLLPHLFTLTSGLRRRRFVFCGTVRREVREPAPRRYLAVCPPEPGLSSKGARRHRSRPSGRSCNHPQSTGTAGSVQVEECTFRTGAAPLRSPFRSAVTADTRLARLSSNCRDAVAWAASP